MIVAPFDLGAEVRPFLRRHDVELRSVLLPVGHARPVVVLDGVQPVGQLRYHLGEIFDDVGIGEGFGGIERRRQDVGDQVLAADDANIVRAADTDIAHRGIGLETQEGEEAGDHEAEGDHQALDGEQAFFHERVRWVQGWLELG